MLENEMLIYYFLVQRMVFSTEQFKMTFLKNIGYDFTDIFCSLTKHVN